MKRVRFLDFLSASGISTKNNLRELESNLEKSIGEDAFIQKICAPLIAGGKRLRPLLFLLCSGAVENSTRQIPLATALELIHTASLVHDDILDSAKKRRGVATINSQYGAQIAVLVGDYLFAKAFQLVAEGNYGDKVSEILSRLVKNLCVGEIMQDRALFAVPTLSEYYTRINLKTAFFLSTCCRLGGIVSNLSDAETENLAAYGGNLGLAFQIVDDLLDFFGEENVTGKPLGGDLKSGVITLPVIRALKVSADAEILSEIIARQKVSATDVETAIKIISATDAAEYCRIRAQAHIDCAKINLPAENFALEQIADFVINRKW